MTRPEREAAGFHLINTTRLLRDRFPRSRPQFLSFSAFPTQGPEAGERMQEEKKKKKKKPNNKKNTPDSGQFQRIVTGKNHLPTFVITPPYVASPNSFPHPGMNSTHTSWGRLSASRSRALSPTSSWTKLTSTLGIPNSGRLRHMDSTSSAGGIRTATTRVCSRTPASHGMGWCSLNSKERGSS